MQHSSDWYYFWMSASGLLHFYRPYLWNELDLNLAKIDKIKSWRETFAWCSDNVVSYHTINVVFNCRQYVSVQNICKCFGEVALEEISPNWAILNISAIVKALYFFIHQYVKRLVVNKNKEIVPWRNFLIFFLWRQSIEFFLFWIKNRLNYSLSSKAKVPVFKLITSWSSVKSHTQQSQLSVEDKEKLSVVFSHYGLFLVELFHFYHSGPSGL